METVRWLVLGAVLIGLVWKMLSRRSTRTPPRGRVVAAEPTVAALPDAAPAAMPPSDAAQQLTGLKLEVLRGFKPVFHQRTAFEQESPEVVKRLRLIPHPPRVLDKMMSMEFVARSSSSELSELIAGEPLVAARVIAEVNSSFHGLSNTVASIEQAITYLGVSRVRNVCLRYLLDEAFTTSSPQVREQFELLRRSSALGSDVCMRLAKILDIPDAGALATQVILSFIGDFAVVLLQAQADASFTGFRERTFIERLATQQKQLGLATPELGRLLMREWTLPELLTDEVASIGWMVTWPAQGGGPDTASHRLILAYLCARLGERFASGRLKNRGTIETLIAADPDFHCVSVYLQHSPLPGFQDALRSPDIMPLPTR